MEWAEDMLDGPRVIGMLPAQNFHLSNPIRSVEQLSALGFKFGTAAKPTNRWRRDWDSFKMMLPDTNKPVSIDHSGLLSHFEEIQSTVHIPACHLKHHQDLFNNASNVFELQKDLCSNFVSTEIESCPTPHFNGEQRKVLAERHYLVSILKQLSQLTASNHKHIWNDDKLKNVLLIRRSDTRYNTNVYQSAYGSTTIIADGRFTYINDPNLDQDFILSRDQLLLLQDCFYSRYILFLDGILSQNWGLLHHLNTEELMIIFKFGDNVLSLMGNQGYEILGKWEAICTAIILKSAEDPYCDSTIFEKNLDNDIKELTKNFDQVWYMITVMKDWLFGLISINPSKLTQSYGLFRIWGHPIIDIMEGISRLKQLTTRVRVLDYNTINKIQGTVKRLFCTRYYGKHGRWPNLDISQLSESSYLRQIISKSESLNQWDPLYDEDDWGLIEGLETFVIPDNMDLAEILDDKSLSPDLMTVIKNIKRLSTIGVGDEKSVIMSYLRRALTSARQLLQHVALNGYPPEERLVGVCPKEKELKIIARFFGLLPLIKRLTVVITESLIGTRFLPYIPEITMMDDETTLKKKFLKYTKEQANIVKVVTNIDFMKWNSFMRKEETFRIFKFLDGLFGLDIGGGVISRTHEMFSESVLYLSDGSFIPPVSDTDILDSEISWRGHLGGIEGQRQKGWTIFTMALIHTAVSPHGVDFKLLGQGDNQVLILNFDTKKYPEPSMIKEKHKQILESLDNLLKKIGPPLKSEETWSSSNYFIYGKYPIWKGVPLSLSMKKICRLYDISNEGIPTLETSLSSLAANTAASINSDVYPWSQLYIYLLTLRESIEVYLKNSPLNQKSIFDTLGTIIGNKSVVDFVVPENQKSTKKQYYLNLKLFKINSGRVVDLSDLGYECMMMFPNSLGGLPIQLIPTFLMKGFPDPLTLDISILRKIFEISVNKGTAHHTIINVILSPLISSTVNYRMLFEDPVSLNLLRPSTAKEILKRRLATHLVKEYQSLGIVNEQFVTFMTLYIKDKSVLYEILSSVRPFNPRVIHMLLEATLQGQATRFLNKINSSGTMLKKFLATRRDADPIADIKRGEVNFFKNVLSQLSTSGDYSWKKNTCSTVWASELRANSWQIDKEHWEGMTVASPLEAFQGYFTNGMKCNDLGHPNQEIGYLQATPTFSVDPNTIDLFHFPLGCSIPYFGSKTFDKLSQSARQIIADCPTFLQSAVELQQFIGWGTEKNSNFAGLIRSILHALTNVDFSLAESQDNTVAGSVGHRVQDHATKKEGILPIMYNVPSNLSLSSNTLTAYSKGSGNVNLYFQTLFIAVQSFWSVNLVFNFPKLHQRTIHYHQSCKECIIPINETSMEIPYSFEWSLYIDSVKGNPYCWLDKNDFITEQVGNRHILENSSTMPITQSGKMRLLSRILAQFICQQLGHLGGDISREQNFARQFNVSWIFKSNIRSILFETLFVLSCKHLLSITLRPHYRWAIMASTLLGKLEMIPTTLGEILQPCVFNPNLMDYLAQWTSKSHIGTTLQGELPTAASITELLKRGLELCIEDLPTYLQEETEEIDYFDAIIPDHSATSPSWMILCRQFIIREEMSSDIFSLMNDIKSLIASDQHRFGNTLDIKRKHQDMRVSGINFSKESEMYLHGFESKGNVLHPDTICKFLSAQIYPVEENQKLLVLPVGVMDLSKLICSSSQFELSCITINQVYDFNNMSCAEFDYSYNDSNWYPPRAPLGQSTAPLKLATLIPLNSNCPEQYLICGDGAGGYTFLSLTTNENRKVWFNTLLRSESILPHSLGNFIPSYLFGWPGIRERLLNKDFISELPSDLTSSSFYEALNSCIITNQLNFSLLVSDAEGISWESRFKELSMITQLLHFASQNSISKCCIKIYAGTGDWIRMIAHLSLCFYSEFEIRRCILSYPKNSELFLLLAGPLTTPRDIPSLSNTRMTFSKFSLTTITEVGLNNSNNMRINNSQISISEKLNKCFLQFCTNSRIKMEIVLHQQKLVEIFEVEKKSKNRQSSLFLSYIKYINNLYPLIKFSGIRSRRTVQKNQTLTVTTTLKMLRIYFIYLGMIGCFEERELINLTEQTGIYYQRTGPRNYIFALTQLKESVNRKHQTLIYKGLGRVTDLLSKFSKNLINYYTTSRLMSEEPVVETLIMDPYIHTV
nr:TPA_asm: RNA-dependent RNA polymerase [Chalcocoris rutilans mononega-like virus 1]